MRKVRSFWRISRRRKALFLAVVLLSLGRFVLRAVYPRGASTERLYRDRRPEGPLDLRQRRWARDVAWAVQAGVRYIPWRNVCRHQAWQAAVLLTALRIPYAYFVGVRRHPEEGLQGHAWVKVEQRFVCGHCDERSYTLVDFLGQPSHPALTP